MKKIDFRKVSDILSDRQLKAVIGGYGPGEWDECCHCNYTLIWNDLGGGKPVIGGGWFCGNYGDPNCDGGVVKWAISYCKMFNGELARIEFSGSGCPTTYHCQNY